MVLGMWNQISGSCLGGRFFLFACFPCGFFLFFLLANIVKFHAETLNLRVHE